MDVLSVLLFVCLKSERYDKFCVKVSNTATNFVVKRCKYKYFCLCSRAIWIASERKANFHAQLTRCIQFVCLSDAIHMACEHRQNAIQCLNDTSALRPPNSGKSYINNAKSYIISKFSNSAGIVIPFYCHKVSHGGYTMTLRRPNEAVLPSQDHRATSSDHGIVIIWRKKHNINDHTK